MLSFDDFPMSAIDTTPINAAGAPTTAYADTRFLQPTSSDSTTVLADSSGAATIIPPSPALQSSRPILGGIALPMPDEFCLPVENPASTSVMMQRQGNASSSTTSATGSSAKRSRSSTMTGKATTGTTPIRVACKARGIPNHTPSTAYLEIPQPNPPHGLILTCCHPECQSTNRRFRYCAVCNVPVAKRNFIKRHDHGLLIHKSGKTLFPSDGPAYEEEAATMPPSKRPRVTQVEVAKDKRQLERISNRQNKPKQHRSTSGVAAKWGAAPAPAAVVSEQQTLLSAKQEALAMQQEQDSNDYDLVVSFQPTSNTDQPTSIVIPASMLEPAPVSASSPTNVASVPVSVASSTEGDADQFLESATAADCLSPKEREWLELYHSRPQHNDGAMCGWIKNVLDHSSALASGAPIAAPPAPTSAFETMHYPAPVSSNSMIKQHQPSHVNTTATDADADLREFLGEWHAV